MLVRQTQGSGATKKEKRGRASANDEGRRQGQGFRAAQEGPQLRACEPCPVPRQDSCLLGEQIPKCFDKPKSTRAKNAWQTAIYSLH